MLELTCPHAPKEPHPPTHTPNTMNIVDVQDEWPTLAESSPSPMDMTQDPTLTKMTPPPDATLTQADMPMPPASPTLLFSSDMDLPTISMVTLVALMVVFVATNTVVVPSLSPNIASVVQKQLAPVFVASSS